MGMKHRLAGSLLLAAFLTLAGCAPPDAGADDESSSPGVESSVPPGADEASATPMPSPTEDYEY